MYCSYCNLWKITTSRPHEFRVTVKLGQQIVLRFEVPPSGRLPVVRTEAVQAAQVLAEVPIDTYG